MPRSSPSRAVGASQHGRRRVLLRVLTVFTAAIIQADLVVLAGALERAPDAGPAADREVAIAPSGEPGDVEPVEEVPAATTDPSVPGTDPATPGSTTTPGGRSTTTRGRTTTTRGSGRTTTTKPATTSPSSTAPASTAPSGPSAPSTSPTTAAPGPTPASPAATLTDAVRALQGFVETSRGLSFKSQPAVAILPDSQFRSRLTAHRKFPRPEDAPRYEGVMRALGLIDGGTNLATELGKLNNRTVVAFYDRRARELVVKDGQPTAFVRTTLVHELTTALDDQHFGVNRPALDAAEDETAVAFTSLVSGTADLVADRYLAVLSEPERAQVQAERDRLASQIARDIPRSVLVTFTYPYVAGSSLVAALLQAGGIERVNAAFQAPPSTTEHLVDPARFVAGETAAPVATPQADGAVVRRGVVGQLGLLLMLTEVTTEDVAKAASSGWGGDRFVSWKSGTQTCVRATFRMDTPEDERQLTDALRQWASSRSGATLNGTTITRCA